MASLSKSASNTYIGPSVLANGRYEAYKALITEVADSLMEEDIEKIVWLYDLPRKTAKGHSPLDVLTNLHKNGKLSENNLDGLEGLLEKIKRKDLVEKHLVPYQHQYRMEDSAEGLRNQEDGNTAENHHFSLHQEPEIFGFENATPTSIERWSHSSTCSIPQQFILSPQETGESDRSSVAMSTLGRSRYAPIYPKRPLLTTNEPRNASLGSMRYIHHSQSMNSILELTGSGGQETGLTRSISLQQLAPPKQPVVPSLSSPIQTPSQRQRRSGVFGWIKMMKTSKPVAKQEDGMLQWPVKIELIQKYIYTRKLRGKKILCTKKLELSGEGWPSLKLSFQLHPYGTLSDANRNVTFLVEIERQRKAKQQQVQRDTKLRLQLTVSSNSKELAKHNCTEDFRMSSFFIDQMVSHDNLKSLDHTHSYLVLAIQAHVQLPQTTSSQ